jgi:glycosyltransferase involved in cell wall biosynthesis
MLLFLMPTWEAPSELWMRRMLDCVHDKLAAVACYEAPLREWRGVPVIDLGARRDSTSIEAGKQRLRDLCRTGMVTAALAHYLPFALRYDSLWAEFSKLPLYVHAHGYDLTWDLQRSDPAGTLVPFHVPTYADDVVRLSLRATILANSRLSATKLRGIGVPEQRIRVKYLGVPVGAYTPPPTPSPGRLDAMFLGRLVDFKGPLETLAAFELAASRGLAGGLTFAGDGPLLGELTAAVQRSPVRPRVKLLGPVTPEHGQLLRGTHHVFVAHSQLGPTSRQEEALGVAYLEALAAGLPVVSASGGSLSEIVTHDQTGLLTPPGDITAQADALLRLASDVALWQRLSRNAHTHAATAFSADTERRELLSLLPSVP